MADRHSQKSSPRPPSSCIRELHDAATWTDSHISHTAGGTRGVSTSFTLQCGTAAKSMRSIRGRMLSSEIIVAACLASVLHRISQISCLERAVIDGLHEAPLRPAYVRGRRSFRSSSMPLKHLNMHILIDLDWAVGSYVLIVGRKDVQ